MATVATTVSYSDKDVRELLLEDAKRKIPGNVGAASIKVLGTMGPDSPQELKACAAQVSFEGVQAKR